MRVVTLVAVALALTACTRVETGEVGLRKTFNGTVEREPLGVGFHQTLIGDVLVFSGKEVLVPVKDLHPVTNDKLPMEDVDVQFTYKVNPAAIPELYTHYSTSYHAQGANGEIFIMQTFIEQFVRSALADAIAQYKALDVNDKRAEIVGLIQTDVTAKIKREGLDKDVSVGQIVFTNVSIPRVIVESTAKVVTAQNELRAASFTADQARIAAKGTADAQVTRAEGEAKAIAAQAQTINAQGGASYLQLEAIRKWNGTMPTYLGSGAPIPFIGPVGK
jgi:regulator of protease activity HflC (stomatin/prohibitin superfamily)